MDNALKICELLADKKRLFSEYELETRAITDCDVDDVEAHVVRRQQLIVEIDGLDAQIEELCGDDKLLAEAVHNRCAHGELSKQQQQVFMAAQEVFAVASRVQTAEERALTRIREERDELQEKIRANNRGMEAQAAKYYGGEPLMGRGGSHFGSA